MAWLAQCGGTVITVIVAVAFLNFVFGSCWLFIVIADDITNDVGRFNDIIAIRDTDDRMELMERFRDIVEHYADAKQ